MHRRWLFPLLALFSFAIFGLLAAGCHSQRQIAVSDEGAQCRMTLAAAGDITLSQRQLDAAKQADGSYDFSPVFASVTGELTEADLAVANLEGNFCGAPYDAAVHNYPESLAMALRGAGLDILQTANTYTVENGLTGLQSTIDVLQSAGLAHLGTFASAEDRAENAVTLWEVNGIRVAFIGFTKGVNNVRLPTGAEYCVNLLYTDYDSSYSQVASDDIAACVAEAEELEPDVIVAMVHWGSEYDPGVSASQQEIEQALFYNGVDVILGSHSHLAGQISQKTVTDKDGEEKNVVVAYSLGNFFSDDEQLSARESLILNLEFTKYDDGLTEITAVDYTPIYITGADEGEFSVLHAPNAIKLYESNYYDRVSDELYQTLCGVADHVAERVTPPEEE